MTVQYREALVNEIIETQPILRGFVRDLTTDMTAGSWDMVSYSFQRGFEAMWDLACADPSGLLNRPLLMLWRQSIELAIKSAILDIAGCIDGRPGHDLDVLFNQLLSIRAGAGYLDTDDLAENVKAMIRSAQSFDPFADRFRYPAGKSGRPDVGITIDFDELFQAHWIIITWCEGAAFPDHEKLPLSCER